MNIKKVSELNKLKTMATGVAFGGLLLSGCGTTGGGDLGQLQAALKNEQMRAQELEASKSSLESQLSERNQKVEQLMGQITADGGTVSDGDNLPPQAKPGECYARVFHPPVYETTSTEVIAKEGSETIRVTPAVYDTVQETVLVKDASKELRVVPAVYEWVEERVLLKEASQRLEVVPAVYETVSERLLVRPAQSVWKKGRGPIEKLDDATGEIMCLVEIPAEYRTVTQQKLVTPASTTTVAIPEEYGTVRKRVLVEDAKTVEVEIPAVYDTVTVRKMVTPPGEERVAVPAVYKTVNERALVREGELKWQSILCETNTNADIISRLQRALQSEGYNPGRTDGVYGRDTAAAVTRYQTANGMPSGGLTIETLQRLNVMEGS